MKKPVTISNLITGTVQGKQVPSAALSPSHFVVDERDTMQLLSYCTSLGAVLDYYDQWGKQDGAWNSFMLADVSLLTAWIAQHNHAEAFAQFLDFLVAIEEEDQRTKLQEFTQQFFSRGFETVLKINEWYLLANQNFASNSMVKYLREVISGEGSELLSAFYASYLTLVETLPWFTNNYGDVLIKLDSCWSFNAFPDIAVQKVAPSGQADFLKKVVASSADTGQLLFNLQTEITKTAAAGFYHSLQRKDIPPHIGLLLSFVDIFKTQREALNTLTARHLDFYYHDVLLGVRASAIPDASTITLQLAKDHTIVQLPGGTELSAGKDANGQPITFSTVNDEVITSTQLARYLTLNFPSAKSSPLNDVYKGEVVKFNQLKNTPWPLFGGGVSLPDYSVQVASLGFAFSSADLLLNQGTRVVTITFSLSPQASTIVNNSNVVSFFELQLTASTGWYTAKLSPPTDQVMDHELLFSFQIDPSDPPIVPYNEKLHGTGYAGTMWPVCKIELTTSGKQSYQSLKNLSFSNVTVNTSVNGLFNFIVENDSGKLSSTTPFIPFNDPIPGANLYVGGRELFAKQVTNIQLMIVWDKLPSGFKEYYQEYNDYYNTHKTSDDEGTENIVNTPVFQNQVFEAELYVLEGDVWMSVMGKNNNPSSYCLFTDETTDTSKEAPLVSKGEKVIIANGPFPFNANLPEYTALDNNLLEGFFCLTLSAPAKGFGSLDYPTIVSTVTLENSIAAMHNARLFVFQKKKIQSMPRVPYVPRISGLEITYTSNREYALASSLTDIKCYHIHPYGIEAITSVSETLSFVPGYDHLSYIYFGLDTIFPDTALSIFFTINNPAKSATTTSPTGISYEYLAQNGWQPLTVVSDSTEGFQCTGIAKFIVPSDIIANGTAVPPGFYWLRIGQDNSSVVTTTFVAPQAVSVKRMISSDDVYTPVKAGTITKFLSPQPAFRSVLQPVNAAGGQPAQTEDEFRMSTASRLHYKKRARSITDIEALVLDEFPQLYKVTAIPLGYSNPALAGHVDVIVTPWTSIQSADCYAPITPLPWMLDILNFLQDVGMPSVQYKISNPDLYQQMVSCQVTFTEPYKNNEFITRLNTDIQNFMSPWIKDNPVPEVSVTVSSAALHAFVKSRSYVTNIIRLTLLPPVKQENDYVVPVGTTTSSGNETQATPGPSGLIIPASRNRINASPSTGTKVDDTGGLRVGETFYLTN